jgi:nucleotidyltransferase substrate binding protein (TIGR01987 family)
LKNASWQEYEKALIALAEALALKKDSITRDASIQRFEFCVELAWKTAKKVMGTASTAPKSVIREMAQSGFLDDPEEWFGFLEARNLSSHTYKEELAEKVYAVAKVFLPKGQILLQKLKSK